MSKSNGLVDLQQDLGGFRLEEWYRVDVPEGGSAQSPKYFSAKEEAAIFAAEKGFSEPQPLTVLTSNGAQGQVVQSGIISL